MLRAGVLRVTHARETMDGAGSNADSTGDPPLVRSAANSDLAGIEELLRASDLPLVGVEDALPTFVVAEDAGAIVGVAGLEIHEGHALLRSVAVAAQWRSRGLGRTLVERMIAQANARGLESIHLLTTTADRYFPTFGFAPISREEMPQSLRASEEFTTACPASATVMRLLCDRKSRDGKC